MKFLRFWERLEQFKLARAQLEDESDSDSGSDSKAQPRAEKSDS